MTACPCLLDASSSLITRASTTRSRKSASVFFDLPASTTLLPATRNSDTDELKSHDSPWFCDWDFCRDGRLANYREPGALFMRTLMCGFSSPIIVGALSKIDGMVSAFHAAAGAVDDASHATCRRGARMMAESRAGDSTVAARRGCRRPLNFNRFFLRSSGELLSASVSCPTSNRAANRLVEYYLLHGAHDDGSQPQLKTCCGAPGSLKRETLRLEPRPRAACRFGAPRARQRRDFRAGARPSLAIC